jgi:hypothetical protein
MVFFIVFPFSQPTLQLVLRLDFPPVVVVIFIFISFCVFRFSSTKHNTSYIISTCIRIYIVAICIADNIFSFCVLFFFIYIIYTALDIMILILNIICFDTLTMSSIRYISAASFHIWRVCVYADNVMATAP